MNCYAYYLSYLICRVNTISGSREDELGTNTALIRTIKYVVMCAFTTHAVTCCWYALVCDGIHQDVERKCYNGTWAINDNVGKSQLILMGVL